MANTTVSASNGVVGGYGGENPTILRAMTAFTAIAWYNAIELIILVFLVFKRYSGLYFWSLLITSISIIPYALGAWTKQIRIMDIDLLAITLSSFGWMVMITGQSIVLYSRLHLVTQNDKLLRFVLWMIIIDAIVLYIPTTVLVYGSNTSAHAKFAPAYSVVEKTQMSIFSLQEFIISGIYLWEVRKILGVVYEGGTRKIMYELITINIAIIVLDVALLSVEYVDLYQIEVTLKGMVYSIKLKLEFGVLSKLVKTVTNKHDPHRVTSNEGEIDLERFPSRAVPGEHDAQPSKDLSGTEHIEDVSFQEFLSTDHSKPSDQTDGSLGLAEPPLQPPQRLSRRSSTSDFYPGRLD